MRRQRMGSFFKTALWITIISFSLAWGITAALAEDDAEAADLSSLSISGPSSVNESSTAGYTATAKFSDGSTRTVTSRASWSENSYYASISGGVLTTRSVSSNRTVTITARYSYDGVSRSAQKSVTIVNAGTQASLTSLAITGPATVAANSTASYTATASFSNGTTQNVTTGATWSENSTFSTISTGGVLTTTAPTTNQAVSVGASYTSGGVTRTASLPVTITAAATQVSLTSLAITGPATVAANSTASYTATATFSNGTTQNVTTGATWSENSTFSTISTGGVLTTTAPTTNQTVSVGASYTSGGVTRTATRSVTITAATTPPPSGSKSINSTSQNRASLPSAPVPEQTFVTQSAFQILANNDLGMHCGDLDHRIASILPPFNVVHAMAIQRGTSTAPPQILTPTEIDVIYSASSNPNDPALANPMTAPVFKTNFWDPNSVQPASTLAFDGYDPFYPPSILGLFPLTKDLGLPVPDLAQLYPISGASALTADQQDMPGVSAPYTANVPQTFKRFDTDLPFFASFPFGYRLTNMNWFAADGIPVAPFDDFGRKNSYPLMRVQAVAKSTALTGRANDVIASVDTVTPVSAEATCFACHISSGDGGGGNAACIPGVDANCNVQGSPRSGTAFIVARVSEDTSTLPLDGKKEWAADNNIIRLHDAKHGTHLQSSTPVVCQTCHYTPALDLAHLGPLGPGDANANGRDQRAHRTNSRVMHAFHGQFTDLFVNDMPPPTDSRRLSPTTGKPVINSFVQTKLNQNCYQCHPGESTKCLRGAMYNGGLICQDCHGTMAQVGNDFSQNFSATTPFPAGADLTKRIPWANVPACQSCHTGDSGSNLGLTDPNVIKSTDGIRLLQAYRTNDANAKPIVATNKRFAEETAANGSTILYRLSKGHSGINCEACHGSTHAEWPVTPDSGATIANDNMTSIQLQGHSGKIVECTSCHAAGSLPVSLGGPHGMHPVNDTRFADGGHRNLASANRAQCRACHGQTGQGTVLSKVAVNRNLAGETFTKGQMVSCNLCHSNPL